MAKIKFAPMYIDSRKVGTLENVEFDIASGDEAQIGSDGYFCHSDGATLSTCSATCLVPVSGVDPQLLLKLLGKTDVKIGLPIDNVTLKLTARPTRVRYTSEPKNGKTQGVFEFGGGAPKAA